MARKLVNTKAMSYEEWLELRRHSIGGSEAGALLGLNPYASSLTLYLDKKGLSKPKETNEAMRIGTDLEEYVAKRFEEKTGKKVRKDNFMYMHDEYDFITANVDREIVGENAGLECKTMSSFNNYDLEGGEVPAYYFSQCQHYMAVKGYERMYLAVLVFQKGIFINTIERNEEFIKGMIEAEVRFWTENIEKNQMPAPDGSEASTDALNELYPESTARSIALPNADALIREYLSISTKIKELKEKQAEIKNKLCVRLGDAESGEDTHYKCSWKSQVSSRVDTDKLKKQFPAIYNEVLKKSESRVFRAKEIK